MSNSSVNSIILHPEELRALKLCKKKRRLTCRDIDWSILASMVHKSVLDKIVPKRGGDGYDWAYYQMSKRGRRYLELRQRREQAANRKRT